MRDEEASDFGDPDFDVVGSHACDGSVHAARKRMSTRPRNWSGI